MEKEKNKKYITFGIAIVVIILIVAIIVFGSNNSKKNNRVQQVKENLNTEIIETNSNATKSENTISNNKVKSENTENSNEIKENTNDIEFTTVNYGDTITTDFVSMIIDSVSSSQVLYPSDTSGVYSYMPDEEGETYFYLTGNLKNTSGESYDVEDIYATMTFDNRYTYTAYLKADDGGNDFYGNYVKPLKSIKYYIYSSVPDELIESYSTCKIRFAFKNNFMHEYKSDFKIYDYRYELDVSK